MASPAELTYAGERVLDAAARLFYRRGINAVGVAEIAAEAGVTKKTLYQQFGSKDALVLSYLGARDQRWWDNIEHRLAGAPRPRALVVFDAYLEHPDGEVHRGCALLNAAVELPLEHPGVTLIADHKSRLLRCLTALIAEDRPDLDQTASAERAEHVFLLLEGANAHLRLGGRLHTDRARELAASILTG